MSRCCQLCRALVSSSGEPGPEVSADQERGEDGVEGGGRAVAVQQSQVRALRSDDLGQGGEVGQRQSEQVGWADPDAVSDADVSVMREDVQDGPAGVLGVAAGAAVLRFVAQGRPVGLRQRRLQWHRPGIHQGKPPLTLIGAIRQLNPRRRPERSPRAALAAAMTTRSPLLAIKVHALVRRAKAATLLTDRRWSVAVRGLVIG